MSKFFIYLSFCILAKAFAILGGLWLGLTVGLGAWLIYFLCKLEPVCKVKTR